MDKENIFEFDKFMNDIEKRKESIIREKNVVQSIIDEDMRRRQRARNYHELWQNQITWGKVE